jgi:regulatory protein
MVDDRLFASMWVSSRHANRHLSARALSRELRRLGVDQEFITAALGNVTPKSEFAAARALAEKRSKSMGGLPEETVIRRLNASLARRGFDSDVATKVVRELLTESLPQPPGTPAGDSGLVQRSSAT